jgi:hypothetical protein
MNAQDHINNAAKLRGHEKGEIALSFDGFDLIVRGSYTPEEKAWLDPRVGIGNPGCDAGFEINEVFLADSLQDAIELFDCKALEIAVLEHLHDLKEAGIAKDECAKHFKVNCRVIKRILDRIGQFQSVVTHAVGTCPTCGKQFQKQRNAAKFCSMSCFAESLATTEVRQADVASMYQGGMTQDEIAAQIGVSQKSVCKALRRKGVKTRVAAKRNQQGVANHMWKGHLVGYKSAHVRVRRYRGAPQACEACGATKDEASLEWANISRQYHDPNDYRSLCVPCHRKWDAERRKKSGST